MSLSYNTNFDINVAALPNVEKIDRAAPNVENVLIGDKISYSNQYPITQMNFRHPILQAFFIHNNIQVSELPDGKIKVVADKLTTICDLNGYLLHNGVDIQNSHALDLIPDYSHYNQEDPVVQAKKELIAALKKTFPKINTLIPEQKLEPLEVPEVLIAPKVIEEIAQEVAQDPAPILNDDQLEAEPSMLGTMLGMYSSALQAAKKLYKKIISPLQAFLLGSISPDYKYDDWTLEVPVAPLVVPTKPIAPVKPVVEPVHVSNAPWNNFSFSYEKEKAPKIAPKPEAQEEKAAPGKNIPGVPKLLFA